MTLAVLDRRVKMSGGNDEPGMPREAWALNSLPVYPVGPHFSALRPPALEIFFHRQVVFSALQLRRPGTKEAAVA